MTEAPYDERSRRGGGLRLAAVGLLLLMVAAAAGVGAAALVERRADSYRSSAVLLIDQEPGLTASVNDGLINKLIRLRLKYVDLVGTTTFSDSVAATTGLSNGRVHTALSGNAAPSSLLLRVSAADRDPATAQQIAQVAAESLRDMLAAEQTALGIKLGNRVTLTVVTPAQAGTQTSPAQDRVRLVGVVVAVGVLGVGAALVSGLRRRD